MIANMSQCKLDIPAPLIVLNGMHALHGAKIDNPGFFKQGRLGLHGGPTLVAPALLERC